MGNYLCKGQPFLIPGLNNKSPIGRLNHYCKLYLLFSSLLCFLDQRLSLKRFYKTGLFSYKTAMFLQDIHGFYKTTMFFFVRQSFFYKTAIFLLNNHVFLQDSLLQNSHVFYKTAMFFKWQPFFNYCKMGLFTQLKISVSHAHRTF